MSSVMTMNCYLQEDNDRASSKALKNVSKTDDQSSIHYSASMVDELLSLDVFLTQKLAICADPRTLFQKSLRFLCYLLELSGHGVFWFTISAILFGGYLLTYDHFMWTYSVNLFSILVVDIIIVAPVKLFFQRPRPRLNKGHIPLSISSVDKYAFPSGHTSRCVSLALLFCYLFPYKLHTDLFCVWALSVCVSRVLIGRHHISDVVVGIVAGFIVFQATIQMSLLLS
jgi:membrane-associated phospholipid phosphatase